MKLDGRITILIGRDSTTIEIKDNNANITFATIKLTPEQLSRALGREGYVECEVQVRGLDMVGKKHEHSDFVFAIAEDIASSKHSEELRQYAQSMLSDGWIADGYFSSQNSFFKKDGKQFARVIIRRYV